MFIFIVYNMRVVKLHIHNYIIIKIHNMQINLIFIINNKNILNNKKIAHYVHKKKKNIKKHIF